jgi:hypothetical protein
MNFLRSLAALLLLAAPAAAQTTGFPFVNDLTVNGFLSGSTSCNFTNQTGNPLTFQVTAAPNAPVLLIFDTYPCVANTIPLPPSMCYGMLIPQSFDLSLAPGAFLWTWPGATNAAGFFTVTFPASSSPIRFSVQGLVLDPICTPFLLTQAYQVSA